MNMETFTDLFGKALLGFFVLLLVSCAVMNYGVRQYDPVEYSEIVQITVDSTRAIHFCGDEKSNQLFWLHIQSVNSVSMLLEEYMTERADSKDLHQSITNIRLMVNDILIRGNFSQEYCVEKLTNIQASSRILARALGGTDKYNLCDGGITNRLSIFTNSYKNNKITESEYKELVGDVVRLGKVDKISCDFTTKQKQLEEIKEAEYIISSLISL